MALPSSEITGFLLCFFTVLVRVVPGLAQLEGSAHVIPTVVQRSLQDASSYPGYDEYSWMWGDAGTHLLGHTLAEVDLLRWSEWKSCAATIRDLEAFKNPHNSKRPVEMIGRSGHRPTEPHPDLQAVTAKPRMLFTNMDAAIRYLNNSHTAPAARLLLALAAPVLLACCGCLGCCLLGGGKKGHKASKRKGCTDPEASGESSSDEPLCADQSRSAAMEDKLAGRERGRDPHTAHSCRGAPQEGAEQECELRRLLLEVDCEAPQRAPPSPQGQASPLGPARRAEAQQEVERILAARDLRALLGEGSPAQRRSEYRRLVRMLHPDKGLVSGERATLALRRIVEYQATLSVGE